MTLFGNRRPVALAVASLMSLLALVSARRALAQADMALDSAQKLVHRAVVTMHDTPLARNAEAAEVITALRSADDKDLMPLFLKMRESTVLENQIFGMVAATVLAKHSGMDPESKEFNYLDLKVLFKSKEPLYVGSALSSMINAEALSQAQLREITDTAPDMSHRAMAAGELNRTNRLVDRKCLQDVLANDNDVARYYTSTTMLAGKDDEHAPALAALKALTEAHDLRMTQVQVLMLIRIQKEKIAAAVPWVAQLAGDDQVDENLRYNAVATLLMFKAPEGVAILGDLIQKQKDSTQQVKLGLVALEYADQLKPEALAPLLSSKSALVKTIAQIAQKNCAGKDITPDMISLLKEGHPIVLDWSMTYADHCPAERQLALRAEVINQATIVDGIRDRDYERAAMAAQKILNEDGDPGRTLAAGLLKSENRAVAEATLAGIFRSDAKNQAALISPAVWDALTRTTSADSSTNFAALILAREGRVEALTWLPNMVTTAQSPGFRALAGWYYAKLKGQQKQFLDAVLNDKP